MENYKSSLKKALLDYKREHSETDKPDNSKPSTSTAPDLSSPQNENSPLVAETSSGTNAEPSTSSKFELINFATY